MNWIGVYLQIDLRLKKSRFHALISPERAPLLSSIRFMCSANFPTTKMDNRDHLEIKFLELWKIIVYCLVRSTSLSVDSVGVEKLLYWKENLSWRSEMPLYLPSRLNVFSDKWNGLSQDHPILNGHEIIFRYNFPIERIFKVIFLFNDLFKILFSVISRNFIFPEHINILWGSIRHLYTRFILYIL